MIYPSRAEASATPASSSKYPPCCLIEFTVPDILFDAEDTTRSESRKWSPDGSPLHVGLCGLSLRWCEIVIWIGRKCAEMVVEMAYVCCSWSRKLIRGNVVESGLLQRLRAEWREELPPPLAWLFQTYLRLTRMPNLILSRRLLQQKMPKQQQH